MNILNKESGVYGLSNGFSSDFRDLEDAYLEGNEELIILKFKARRAVKFNLKAQDGILVDKNMNVIKVDF